MTLVLLAAMPGISHAQKKVADQTQRQRTYETIAPVVQKEQPKVFWYGGEVNLGAGVNLLAEGATVFYCRASMDLETIHGVFITKYAYIGAGLQIKYINAKELHHGSYFDYYDAVNRVVFLPFFLHFRLNVPVNTHITPYISCSTNLKSRDEDKCYLAVHLGMTINNRWNVGLGYDEYATYNDHGWDRAQTIPNIKVGYVFGSKGAAPSKK